MGNAVSAPAYSNLAIWNTTTWEITSQNGFHEDGMREIALHPNGELITGAMHSSLLTLWDVDTLDFSRLVGIHNPVQNVLAWSPDGNQLASTSSYSSESSVLIWNLADYTTTEIDQPSQMLAEGVFSWIPVTSLRWDGNNELITISESDSLLSEFDFRSVERWNPETGESRGVIYATEYARGEAAFNSDFTLIAQEDYDNTHIEIRRVDTDELLFSIPMEMSVADISWVRRDQALSLVTWNPETNDYAVELRDSDTGELLVTSQEAEGSSGRTAQNPVSHLRGVATLDDLRFLDTSTGETVEIIPIAGIIGLAWSPDSTRLALGMSDGTIRIWDVSDLIQPTS
jgi:WD40 repeat protein